MLISILIVQHIFWWKGDDFISGTQGPFAVSRLIWLTGINWLKGVCLIDAHE